MDLNDPHTAAPPILTGTPGRVSEPLGVRVLEEADLWIGSEAWGSASTAWNLELEKIQEILSGSPAENAVSVRKSRRNLWLALAGGVALCSLGVVFLPGSGQDAVEPPAAPVQSIPATPARAAATETVSTANPRNLFRATAPVLQDEPGITAFPENVEPRVIGPDVQEESASADAEGRWTNSLGMAFVPVGGVKFSVWETRVQDYETFSAATGRARQRALYEESGMHPVTMVDWEDAKAFCDWLTKKELAEGVLMEGQRYRLPTDLEWSQAAGLSGEKGSSPSARDTAIKGQYPWGTAWPPPVGAGNFSYGLKDYDDGFAQTAPVGSFQSNPFGLYDMTGNVWEWCEDGYSSRSSKRVTRGGSWTSDSRDELESTCRNPVSPERRGLIYGFRCVLAE
jgi:hypothetical protein